MSRPPTLFWTLFVPRHNKKKARSLSSPGHDKNLHSQPTMPASPIFTFRQFHFIQPVNLDFDASTLTIFLYFFGASPRQREGPCLSAHSHSLPRHDTSLHSRSATPTISIFTFWPNFNQIQSILHQSPP